LYSFEGIDDGKREEKAERGAELLHSLTAAGAKAATTTSLLGRCWCKYAILTRLFFELSSLFAS
jgi:hypothetical protein